MPMLGVGKFFVLFILFVSPLLVSAQGATPSVTITASKTSMIANAKSLYADLPIIFWTSANVSSCTASGVGWSGKIALSGSQRVNPPVTTTYTMTCTGTGGSVSQSVTITVTPSRNTVSQVANVLTALDQITGGVAKTDQKQTAFSYTWNRNLQLGSPYASDVSALQTALTQEGVFSNEITGGFYSKTFTAVKLFQKKYSINATGFVGPLTRAKLNELYRN